MLTYFCFPISHQPPYIGPSSKIAEEAMAHWIAKEGLSLVSVLTLLPLFKEKGAPDLSEEMLHRYAENLLQKSDQMMVLQLEGWEMSDWVSKQMDFARKRAISIALVDPITYEIIGAIPEGLLERHADYFHRHALPNLSKKGV